MGARVLLVDDEAAVRRLLSVAMAERGIETREAGDGLSALHEVDRQSRMGRPFHVAVVDLRLPDIDGLKLLSLFKSRFPELKVLVISGYGDADTAEQVRLRRGEAFVPKPFAPGELVRRVTELAGASRAEPAEAGPRKPAAAYVFLKLDAAVDTWKVLTELAAMPDVQSCDPVRDGEWNVVLRFQGPSPQELESRARQGCCKLPGVALAEVFPVAVPAVADELRSFMEAYNRENADNPQYRRTPERATSYVLVDANPPDLANLYVRLYFLDEVIAIDAGAAGSRLVLMVQGRDFGHVRRVIDERIRLMDGVTRVHELKVVPLEKR